VKSCSLLAWQTNNRPSLLYRVHYFVWAEHYIRVGKLTTQSAGREHCCLAQNPFDVFGNMFASSVLQNRTHFRAF